MTNGAVTVTEAAVLPVSFWTTSMLAAMIWCAGNTARAAGINSPLTSAQTTKARRTLQVTSVLFILWEGFFTFRQSGTSDQGLVRSVSWDRLQTARNRFCEMNSA